MRKRLMLAACLVAWAAPADARDVDKGTATDDGSGHPQGMARDFIPQHPDVYFKFTNTTGGTIVLNTVNARLQLEEPIPPTPDNYSQSPCGSPTTIVGPPLRTQVMPGRHIDSQNTGSPLGLTLQSCESVLIRASGATPGSWHTVIFDTSLPTGTPVGYLEIWDGDCND